MVGVWSERSEGGRWEGGDHAEGSWGETRPGSVRDCLVSELSLAMSMGLSLTGT